MEDQPLDSFNSAIVVIACQVFQTLLEGLLPDDMGGEVSFLDYGLHVTPNNLKKEVQRVIDQIDKPSLVILGYGLCGNGLVGIKSGKHTLIVPRTHDCIAILLGSYDEYQKIFSAEPGTYYLTKGWLEAGSNPLQEYQSYVDTYGLDKANMIMDMQYQNYSRLMYIAHRKEDLEYYEDQVKEIATFCRRWNMRYEEKFGSDHYIKNFIALTEEIRSNGTKAVDDAMGKDFAIIHPNSVIEQRIFFR